MTEEKPKKYELRSSRISLYITKSMYNKLMEMKKQGYFKSVNDLTVQLYKEYLEKNGKL